MIQENRIQWYREVPGLLPRHNGGACGR